MIGKLLSGLVSVIAAICVATVIAEGILAVYYAKTWHVDRLKLLQALAIAQGTNPADLVESSGPEKVETSTEQVSYNQVLEARALKCRDIELREQAIRGAGQQLQLEQRKVAEEKKLFLQTQGAFKTELAAKSKGAAATGMEDARRTLETLKPKQAKELIVQMLEKSEMDEVVVMLAAMTDGKRAKIIGEFKSSTEEEQIGEVLRRIRQGMPTSTMVDNTQKKLEPPRGPGS